jgi:N-acetylmuramoyl-L-alanine amidase
MGRIVRVLAGLFALLVPSAALAGVEVSTPASAVELRVLWPEEGASYPPLRRSFVFGHVTPGSGLSVNGASVPVRASGAFLSMVDFSTGAFSLLLRAEGAGASTESARRVSVADFQDAPGGSLAFLQPREDLSLFAGDEVWARVKGPPGGRASFSVEGLAGDHPLCEVSSGIYEGRLLLEKPGKARDLVLSARLEASGRTLKARAPGRLTVWDPSCRREALSTGKATVLKSGSQGYSLFLPPGVLLPVSGLLGSGLRVPLSPGLELWADSSQADLLPGCAREPAGTAGRFLSTAVSSDSVRLLVPLDRKLPFEVRQSVEPLEFEARLFGARQRIDRIRLDPDDPVVKEVLWRQEETGVLLLRVRTRLRWGFGYDAGYDKGRFFLEIRRPPRPAFPAGVLSGRRIALDPGHSPDRGALGPMGSEESRINLAVALQLRDLLEEEGASVFMTRSSSAPLPLFDRPFMACEARADLLVSIHHNALAVSDDPFAAPHGTMTLFFHPQSRPLAEAVHASLRRAMALPDEGVTWGDLHLCRVSQMPAILTEAAYLMLPEQEEILLSQLGRRAEASAIRDGIRDYFEAWRRLQAESPEEARAAAR